jgi:flagella basal body P-ring formation protein FlgA
VWAAGIACALLSLSAWAQTPGAVPKDVLMASTQRWVDEAMARTATDLPLRMEVVVGEPDSRLRLAPCARIENYLPPSTRLWGRSRIGVRCVDGVSRWNIFVPVTVKAFGDAWVVKAGVAPGAVLTPNDAVLAEVDWAEDANTVLADPALWVGQVATRALVTGQVLRQNLVRAAQVFQVGAQVRVLAGGPGFQIASDGQALSGGVIGQLARVRMDNGRILSGTVVDARTVRMAL